MSTLALRDSSFGDGTFWRRVFWRTVKVEAGKAMSYRTDFWLSALCSFFVQMAVAYYLWKAIFAESGSEVIAGYGFDGMVLYYVLVVLLGRLARTDVRQINISKDIYDGLLTRYVLYPAPYLGFKYAENLGALLPALVQLALFGTGCLVLLEFTGQEVISELTLTPGSCARALVAVVLANLLSFLITWPIQAVAFWADNVWSLNVMLRFTASLLGGAMLPITVFPERAQAVLEWLPFQYLYYFPVQTLLGRVSVAEWWAGIGICGGWIIIVYAIGAWVWRRGERVYTGVGI